QHTDGGALLILDEPTTGLHFDDIRMLVGLLDRLVEQGNSLLVIEHNLEVMKCADYIIDLGPEAGNGGGEVVATGTPEAIAEVENSHTGRHLRSLLGDKGRMYCNEASFVGGNGSLRVAEDALLPKQASIANAICVRGAREHNLKN